MGAENKGGEERLGKGRMMKRREGGREEERGK